MVAILVYCDLGTELLKLAYATCLFSACSLFVCNILFTPAQEYSHNGRFPLFYGKNYDIKSKRGERKRARSNFVER